MVWGSRILLIVAGFSAIPAFAQDDSGQVLAGNYMQSDQEVDAEFLEFMADWISDDGEWIDPESLDNDKASVEERYED